MCGRQKRRRIRGETSAARCCGQGEGRERAGRVTEARTGQAGQRRRSSAQLNNATQPSAAQRNWRLRLAAPAAPRASSPTSASAASTLATISSWARPERDRLKAMSPPTDGITTCPRMGARGRRQPLSVLSEIPGSFSHSDRESAHARLVVRVLGDVAAGGQDPEAAGGRADLPRADAEEGGLRTDGKGRHQRGNTRLVSSQPLAGPAPLFRRKRARHRLNPTQRTRTHAPSRSRSAPGACAASPRRRRA